jgi:hypothetical protein
VTRFAPPTIRTRATTRPRPRRHDDGDGCKININANHAGDALFPASH